MKYWLSMPPLISKLKNVSLSNVLSQWRSVATHSVASYQEWEKLASEQLKGKSLEKLLWDTNEGIRG